MNVNNDAPDNGAPGFNAGLRPHTPLAILQAVYGYDRFRGLQGDIIDTLVAGGDALVIMPTGGGKSLCYQIPALLRDGVGIVVSPLIALMQDQVDALQALGIRAAFINSTLSAPDIQAREKALLAGELDLVYVAPERLLMPATLALLERSPVALFAIDEAHCVSQWGHDFRREYLGLSVLVERFPEVPRVALTATADERTRQEIAEQLSLQQARLFLSSFDRPNIRYRVTEAIQARDQLWRFLSTEHPEDAGIVYCLSRKKVDDTADWLVRQGRTALAYHAGLDAEVRAAHQSRFLREEGVIVVATIAFGMGIDKPDVRFVAHLNLPKSIEAYYQETGRAGRDGQPANAWMAYGLQDVINLRSMMEQSDADEQHKRLEHHKLEAMLGLAESTDCRRQAVLAYFGEQRDEPCGNCDNCLSPPKTWDATHAARLALSCVYRTDQRFGVNYLIEVLQGKASERLRRFGHDGLPVFGMGKDRPASQWRVLFRQLIALGLLRVDTGGHGSLQLTQAARPVLRNERVLKLRVAATEKAGSRAGSPTRRARAARTIAPADEPLWEALRDLRRELSDAAGVPAYVVFSDATLHEMLIARPQSTAQLRKVSGVGDQKLERYGQEFLGLLRAHEAPVS